VQGFLAKTVVLTRSLRQDAAPTVPARWLQRLDTVLQAARIDPARLGQSEIPGLALARAMDRADDVRPASRPAPSPPVASRPRELPVTAIETWLQDPYAIYAKYVLKLRKLDPLERSPDAAARGMFLHDVLNDFITAHKTELPADAARILTDLGHKHFENLADDSGFWRYWLPRFDRIASWLAGHEAAWREQARPGIVETKGQIMLQGPQGPFTLTARADRIDHLKAGGAAIIDYKTGGAWAAKAMIEGKAPQLPLEGLILDHNGFPGIAGPASLLTYWKLTGGPEAGKPTSIEGDDVRAAIDNAKAGLEALIAAYDDPSMPYFSLPDPERKPRFQDYAQLARVQEWSVADDASDTEDAA
jgi:ATP-dependent helicase/nuclease subunit B